jgi:hypothetical protein
MQNKNTMLVAIISVSDDNSMELMIGDNGRGNFTTQKPKTIYFATEMNS